MVGNRFAIIDLPDPGGPIIKRLYPITYVLDSGPDEQGLFLRPIQHTRTSGRRFASPADRAF